MFVVVGEEATGVTTLQAKKVGTSAKFREESEGSRSLSRGDAPTQSLGCRRETKSCMKGRR